LKNLQLPYKVCNACVSIMSAGIIGSADDASLISAWLYCIAFSLPGAHNGQNTRSPQQTPSESEWHRRSQRGHALDSGTVADTRGVVSQISLARDCPSGLRPQFPLPPSSRLVLVREMKLPRYGRFHPFSSRPEAPRVWSGEGSPSLLQM
jgi:hypothetical protein